MKFNIFRPILAILILFIPLYPKFPIFAVDNTYVAIRLDDIVVGLAILIWLIYQISHRLPLFRLKITPFLVAYLLSLIASTVTAVMIYQTEPANIILLHFFRRFQYISLFFISLQAVQKRQDLKFPYLALLITSILVSAYGYGQKYLHLPVVSTMNAEFSKGQLLEMNIWTRISSTFAGHYDLAAFYSVALILILGFIVITKNRLYRFSSLIVWLVGFHILTLTASRISIFAFWGGAIMLLFLLRRYLLILPISLLVISSFLTSKDLNQRLLATLTIAKKNIPQKNVVTPTPQPTVVIPTPKLVAKITPLAPSPTIFRHQPTEETIPIDIDAGVARSGEIRFNVEWPRAINAFRKNPISGTGLGSITLATDNDYLRLLGESGILGFITFIAIFIFFVVQSFKAPSQLVFIFLSALMVMLANAIFIDVFEASKTAYTFWIMMGLYYQVLHFSLWPKEKS